MSAYDELLEFLEEDEIVEEIVFGPSMVWLDDIDYHTLKSKECVLLSLEEAKPILQKKVFSCL